MTKRLGSILLSLAMLLSLLPAFTAHARAAGGNAETLFIAGEQGKGYEEDGVWIYNEGYTELADGESVIMADKDYSNAASATFQYGEEVSTLWLNGYRTSGAAGYVTPGSSFVELMGISYDGNLEIILSGDNDFDLQLARDGANYYGTEGISVIGSLTIRNEDGEAASLNIRVGEDAVANCVSYGIYYSEELHIEEAEGGTLSISAVSGPIAQDDEMAEAISAGVGGYEGFMMVGGSLTAISSPQAQDDGECYGLNCYEGDVSILGGAVVYAEGGDADWLSYGIYSGREFCIAENAFVTATSGMVTDEEGKTAGVWVDGDSFLMDGGTLMASGGTAEARTGVSYGVWLGELTESLELEDGSVTAQGNSGAICLNEGCTLAAPLIIGGTKYDGSNAAFVNDFELNWRYAQIVGGDPACAAVVNGTTMTWRAKMDLDAADSGLAIAAWYDGDGRLLGCSAASFTNASGMVDGTLAVAADAAQYKLFLVADETFAPLCKAWRSAV